MSRNFKKFVHVVGLAMLLIPANSVLPVDLAAANAESYTIELGETFFYESCWTRVGSPARLERKVPGKSSWRQVARAKPVRSSECDSGYKLVSYKWKPKTLGKHRLRESLPNAYGSQRTYSKAFTLNVVESSFSDPTTGTVATLPPSSGTGGGSFGSGNNLLGCYFEGQRLWGKVYFTNYAFDADVKVYFTKYSFDADLKVWNAPNSYSVSGCGQWYVTNRSYEADFKIYVSKYSFDADLKIYLTNYQFDAGLP
jgi:hypothetical protein